MNDVEIILALRSPRLDLFLADFRANGTPRRCSSFAADSNPFAFRSTSLISLLSFRSSATAVFSSRLPYTAYIAHHSALRGIPLALAALSLAQLA